MTNQDVLRLVDCNLSCIGIFAAPVKCDEHAIFHEFIDANSDAENIESKLLYDAWVTVDESLHTVFMCEEITEVPVNYNPFFPENNISLQNKMYDEGVYTLLSKCVTDFRDPNAHVIYLSDISNAVKDAAIQSEWTFKMVERQQEIYADCSEAEIYDYEVIIAPQPIIYEFRKSKLGKTAETALIILGYCFLLILMFWIYANF